MSRVRNYRVLGKQYRGRATAWRGGAFGMRLAFPARHEDHGETAGL